MLLPPPTPADPSHPRGQVAASKKGQEGVESATPAAQPISAVAISNLLEFTVAVDVHRAAGLQPTRPTAALVAHVPGLMDSKQPAVPNAFCYSAW
jgi:hypothetical protein